MNISFQLLISALTIYTFLIIHGMRFGFTSLLNRLFFSASFCLFTWTINNVFIYYAVTSDSCMFWYRAGAFGQCFYSAFILHFYIVFTGRGSLFKKRWCYIPFYLQPLILLFGFLTDNVIVKEFIVTGVGVKRIVVVYSFWLYYYLFVHLSYLTLGFIIIVIWRAKLKYSFEIKQAKVVMLPFMTSMVFGVAIGLLSIKSIEFDLLMLIPAAALFGTVGSWFATVKYKLMVLTPSLAAEGILSTMADSVVLVDPDLKILTVNCEICRLLKYEEKELVGKNLGFLFDGNETLYKPDMIVMLKNGMIRNCESAFTAKDGTTIPIAFSASEYRDKNKILIGTIVISRDITEQKKAEQSLKHLAHHDFLTGLPNRLLFNSRLEQAMVRAKHYNTMAAVVLLDVDRFKGVNDVFGHNIGDSLLVEIADRLKSVIRHVDTIARFGGDEFICIINDLNSVCDVNEVAEKIHQAFLPKYRIGVNELTITASIGISMYPLDGDSADILIKNADIAMYHAKNQGKNNYQVYTKELGIECSEKLLLESRLRKAVEKDEFIVYYQPIMDVNTGEVISMEALVRWQHPEKGLIPPLDFIPAAEETGLIIQIGEYVLRTACKQNVQWIEMGLSSVPISVNLSPVQLQQNNLVEMIIGILNETGLDSSFLQMEITEGTAMTDAVKTLSILNQLHEIGITFIVDDFGMGYSSLNYLKIFPVSMIKIDRFFIRNIANSANDAAIVTALFAMAHTLDMKVIAEGVETIEQVEFLRSLQWKPVKTFICYGVQGFYFSKPVPAEMFTDILKKQTNRKSNISTSGGVESPSEAPMFSQGEKARFFTYS